MADQGFTGELEREGGGLAGIEALALRVLADRVEHGEAVPEAFLRKRKP